MNLLLDAGPALNFLAVGQQGVLIQLAAAGSLQLAAPERVDHEVRGKAQADRFRRTGALGTWQKMTAAGRIQLLSDALEDRPVFRSAIYRISGMPAADRVLIRTSLGEIMVLAHASEHAQAGHNVFVLMDDGDGRARAIREQRWLRAQPGAGTFTLWNTTQVLRAAALHPGRIAGNLTWQQVYDRIRQFDDGLPPRRPADTVTAGAVGRPSAMHSQLPRVVADLTFTPLQHGRATVPPGIWEEDRDPAVGERVLVSDGSAGPFDAVITGIEPDGTLVLTVEAFVSARS